MKYVIYAKHNMKYVKYDNVYYMKYAKYDVYVKICTIWNCYYIHSPSRPSRSDQAVLPTPQGRLPPPVPSGWRGLIYDIRWGWGIPWSGSALPPCVWVGDGWHNVETITAFSNVVWIGRNSCNAVLSYNIQKYKRSWYMSEMYNYCTNHICDIW